MTNTSKRRGTDWESAVVEELRAHGWAGAERRALAGALDKGDIAGVPGVMFECKAERAINLAQYMKEVELQTHNAGASVGVAVVKKRNYGARDAYAVMPLHGFLQLLREAGY